MKYLRLLSAAVLAMSALVASASSASAAVTVVGGPYTNLKAAGDTVRLTLTNFPTTAGMYIQQCLNTGTVRPTAAQCNPASQVWVTTANVGTFKPTDTIAIPVVAKFGAVDCSTATCALFFRLDHTAPTDLSEDRFINISFAAATGTSLPLDEITAKINGVTLAPNTVGSLAYRTPVTLVVTTKSGATTTLKVYGDACTSTGMTVTALKGSGQCDIAVTSPGTASYAGVTAHYPVNLTTGVQSLALNLPKQLVGTKLLFTSKTLTNMGEKPKVVVSPSNVCALKTTGVNTMLVAKSKGTCTVTVTAPARDGLYNALNQTYTLSVKSK